MATRTPSKARKATTKAKAPRAKATAKTSPRKTAAKKSPVKATASKAPARKTSARKVVSKKAAAKATLSLPTKVISQKQTKAQIYQELAEMAQINKAQAKAVMAALRNLIERHVKPKGSGNIILPELGIKVRRVQKKATKARMGRNPFTGEEIKIPAKPARKSVRVSVLKNLKEVIE